MSFYDGLANHVVQDDEEMPDAGVELAGGEDFSDDAYPSMLLDDMDDTAPPQKKSKRVSSKTDSHQNVAKSHSLENDEELALALLNR